MFVNSPNFYYTFLLEIKKKNVIQTDFLILFPVICYSCGLSLFDNVNNQA